MKAVQSHSTSPSTWHARRCRSVGARACQCCQWSTLWLIPFIGTLTLLCVLEARGMPSLSSNTSTYQLHSHSYWRQQACAFPGREPLCRRRSRRRRFSAASFSCMQAHLVLAHHQQTAANRLLSQGRASGAWRPLCLPAAPGRLQPWLCISSLLPACFRHVLAVYRRTTAGRPCAGASAQPTTCRAAAPWR